jgi:hypothetical protein
MTFIYPSIVVHSTRSTYTTGYTYLRGEVVVCEFTVGRASMVPPTTVRIPIYK